MFACVLCFGICTLWYYFTGSMYVCRYVIHLRCSEGLGGSQFLLCLFGLALVSPKIRGRIFRSPETILCASKQYLPRSQDATCRGIAPNQARAHSSHNLSTPPNLSSGWLSLCFPSHQLHEGSRTSSNVTPIGPLVPEGSTAFGCPLLEFGLVFLLWTLACNTWKVVFVHLKDLSPGRSCIPVKSLRTPWFKS